MIAPHGTEHTYRVITVESVFISRFTKNNIALKLQKCWTHKIAFKNHIKNSKATKFLSQSTFYTFRRSTCKVLPLYDFWFKLRDKFCSPYQIVEFMRIFNHQNRKPLTLNHQIFITTKMYSWCVAISLCINYVRYGGECAVGWRVQEWRKECKIGPTI